MGDTYCSECRRATEVVFDHSAGDTICSECGLVLDSHSIDETSEWRTFANDAGDTDPARVGGPMNPLLSNASLSTVIAANPSGSNLLPSLGRWQSRSSDPDRCLIHAFKGIAAMADRIYRRPLRLATDAQHAMEYIHGSNKVNAYMIPAEIRGEVVTTQEPSFVCSRYETLGPISNHYLVNVSLANYLILYENSGNLEMRGGGITCRKMNAHHDLTLVYIKWVLGLEMGIIDFIFYIASNLKSLQKEMVVVLFLAKGVLKWDVGISITVATKCEKGRINFAAAEHYNLFHIFGVCRDVSCNKRAWLRFILLTRIDDELIIPGKVKKLLGSELLDWEVKLEDSKVGNQVQQLSLRTSLFYGDGLS